MCSVQLQVVIICVGGDDYKPKKVLAGTFTLSRHSVPYPDVPEVPGCIFFHFDSSLFFCFAKTRNLKDNDETKTNRRPTAGEELWMSMIRNVVACKGRCARHWQKETERRRMSLVSKITVRP